MEPNREPRRNGRVRGMMLPSSPPLRTVQVDFSTYSSSLSLRPCDRTRFLHSNILAMNLLMTGWMKQHAVLCAVSSAFGSPQKVMAVPSRDPGDLLIADGTEAVLLLPQVAEPPSPFQLCSHMHVEAFFKVRFPGRVVEIGLCADFRVPLDADRRSSQQPDHFHLPCLSFEDTGEDPTVWPFIGKVFVFHPAARFVSLSATCPFPDGLEDGMVNSMKDLCWLLESSVKKMEILISSMTSYLDASPVNRAQSEEGFTLRRVKPTHHEGHVPLVCFIQLSKLAERYFLIVLN